MFTIRLTPHSIMFVELCKQRAFDFMQELLKPMFNTIFRASDDSLVSPDLFDKLRDLFITLLNSADVSACGLRHLHFVTNSPLVDAIARGIHTRTRVHKTHTISSTSRVSINSTSRVSITSPLTPSPPLACACATGRASA